ncbi:hypothetical protein SO802_021646 [Lithocarpus litseifolius]|uniref:RNase H type-1 domain-containing protein n=1 Tax=Lithocarpus litseifolius TaxID=425828 RepID=A0AAW2CKE2_9ROSI
MEEYNGRLTYFEKRELLWEWRVSDFIDPSTRCWDREYVLLNFQQEDAEAILRIPLSRGHIKDSVLWLHTHEGTYTVKLGYHVAAQLVKEEKNWAKSSRGSPSIKAGSVMKLQKFVGGQYDMLSLFEELMMRLNEEEFELFLVQAWLIWNQRNRITYGDLGCSGMRVVIQNEKGEIMGAMTAKGLGIADSIEAEALACRKALEFVVDIGITELVIEGDCAQVISAITSNQFSLRQLGHVFEDIQMLIAGLRWAELPCCRLLKPPLLILAQLLAHSDVSLELVIFNKKAQRLSLNVAREQEHQEIFQSIGTNINPLEQIAHVSLRLQNFSVNLLEAPDESQALRNLVQNNGFLFGYG